MPKKKTGTYTREQLPWALKALQARVAMQSARRYEQEAREIVKSLLRTMHAYSLLPRKDLRRIFGPAVRILRRNRVCTSEMSSYVRSQYGL